MPDFNVTGQIGLDPITQIGDHVMTQGLGFPLRPVSTSPGEGVGMTSVLVSQHNGSQVPTGLGVPMQVAFGAPESNEYVSIDAAGTITFIQAGAYMALCNVYFDRSTDQGESLTFLRFLGDGVQAGNPVAIEMDSADTSQFNQFVLAGQVPAGTELTVEIMRDSGGFNDGYLISFTSTDGWGTAPSAIMRVLKF